MSRHHEQALKLLDVAKDDGRISDDAVAATISAAAQVHATLAVADALGRLVEALGSARDVGAERLTAVVTGHSDAMAMVDQLIDQMREGAARVAEEGEPYARGPYARGWMDALDELRRRLHEVDEPAAEEPDPLAHVKVGDRESELAGRVRVGCAVRKHGLLCMRSSHPEQWQHIASDYDGRVLAVWGGVR